MAVKQAVKKGTGIHKKGLSAWKEKNGMAIEKPKEGEVIKASELAVSNANKPVEWILMPKAFQDVTKLPGIKCGTCVSVEGNTNVGKSTMMNHAIVGAQKQGKIPVIIDVENSFSFQYAKAMGFEAEPIYGDVEVEDVDEETGEITGTHIERQIVNYDGNFLYLNNQLLAQKYGDFDYTQGKRVTKKRKVAVVEDIAMAINELLDAQENDEIDADLFICVDAIGSIGCWKEYNAGKIGNPMWCAAGVSQAFSNIVNARIPGSVKQSSRYTNTLFYINKVWIDNQSVASAPVMRKKCGQSLAYATRCSFRLGGIVTSGTKQLTAVSKGLTYSYGLQTKIKVIKNHLDAPYNVCYEGPIVATDTGFIGVDELEDYKKNHVADILKELNKLAEGKFKVEEKDISFEEVEIED